MKLAMLTTVDNPWNPHHQFTEWNAFDLAKGYNTTGLLARFSVTSDALSEVDQNIALEEAIDRIVELNPLGVHRKIFIDYQE